MPIDIQGANLGFDRLLKQGACFVLDHDWLYNAATLPTKSMCARCGKKSKFDPATLTWVNIDSFDSQWGTDEQIKRKWVRTPKN